MCSAARVNQIHLGLKVIPGGLPSLATKNLNPHPEEIRIKAMIHPNNKKVPVICGLAVPEGDASVSIRQLHQPRFCSSM